MGGQEVSEALLALPTGAVGRGQHRPLFRSCCLFGNPMVVVSCHLLRSSTSLCEAGGRLVGVSEPATGAQQGQTLDSICQSGVKADSDPGPAVGALLGSVWAFSHPLRNQGLQFLLQE